MTNSERCWQRAAWCCAIAFAAACSRDDPPEMNLLTDVCLAEGWPLNVELLADDPELVECGKFTFEGRVVEQIAENSWRLDRCACNEECPATSSYRLLYFAGAGGPSVDTPGCFSLEVQTDQDCNIEAAAVRDTEGALAWGVA